jgi:hypothetical protein
MSVAFPLGRSILAAAFILAASATLAWLAPTYLSTEWSHRWLGVLLGSVVVCYSNAIPKALAARSRCSAAAEQAARRFAGWSLVLGGLGYALAWLLAPIGLANLIAGAILATALLLAVLRCLRAGAHAPT